jgi:ribosome-associated protein
MADWVTPRGLRIDDAAVSWTATRSGGPGGQHANTSDTAVELVIDLAHSGLAPMLVERIMSAAGDRVIGRSADSRSQLQNRATAWERAARKLDEAARRPITRRATRPTRGSVERRLGAKRRASERKAGRRPSGDD